MRKISRSYRPGDEVEINRLYKSIAGRDRSAAEYAWEWLDTWAGQGSMNLVFDLDREEGDRLIAQYSLIPVPLSVWGRPTVAGKTENCMSHPEHRGSGMYFSHERECFEQEKQRFSFFFTTAGQVTNGAVGKIRMKLGYVAYDNWAKYALWLREGGLRQELGAIMAAKGTVPRALTPLLSGLATTILLGYSRCRRRRTCGYRVAVHGVAEAPLEQIEVLWEQNRERYGITVDRSARYLQWRINENPYLRHEYLTMFGGDRLLGYVIYYVQHGILHIVDILVDGKRRSLFRHLLAGLVRRGRECQVDSIMCLVLRRSPFLPRRLRSSGFINRAVFSPTGFFKSLHPRQFFLYVPEELRDDPTVARHASWYITELVMEGRDHDRPND